MNETEHRIGKVQRNSRRRLVQLAGQLRCKTLIYRKGHMADLVDRRLIEAFRLLFCLLPRSEFFDVEPVNQIADLIQPPLDARVIRQCLRGSQKSAYRFVELMPRTRQVSLEVKLPSRVEMTIRPPQRVIRL